MKSVQAKDMKDEQWKSFATFNNFLNRENYSQYRDRSDSDWGKIKKKTLDSLNISETAFSNYYYFFNDKEVVAYIEAFERKKKLYFNFDSLNKIIQAEIIKIILDRIYIIMIERNRSESFFHTFFERHYEPLLKLRAEIYDEPLTSRLLKKNIDFTNLKKIAESNKFAERYDLKLFREIPEEIYEKFLIYSNEVSIDSKLFHPKGIKVSEFTMDDILAIVQDFNDDEEPFYMYMLFEKENIAAYCSVYIVTIDNKYVIEHSGALTSVGRNYRGQGLAKYMKAKMYLKIQEDYPDYEYILTDTYPWNKHMYRINEEIGFKPFKKGYTFRFTKEFLENFLK